MKKLINLFIIIFFSISFISSLSCTDNFNSESNIIQICGYCSELNGTPCSVSQSCNFTIYYSNFTKFIEKASAVNNGNGQFY